jgi:hypothetical protein
MVKGSIVARDPYETPQWKRHVNGFWRNLQGLFSLLRFYHVRNLPLMLFCITIILV